MNRPRIILASRSPRRLALLTQAGYDVQVFEPPFEDPPQPEHTDNPAELAMALALKKALSVEASGNPLLQWAGFIIAADTVVVLPFAANAMLGQPTTRAEAQRMLSSLLGRRHQVITGVALGRRPGGINTPWQWTTLADTAEVTLPTLPHTQLATYLDSGRWRGKAGGYNLVELDDWDIKLHGDPTTVIGLPMRMLLERLPPATAQSTRPRKN